MATAPGACQTSDQGLSCERTADYKLEEVLIDLANPKSWGTTLETDRLGVPYKFLVSVQVFKSAKTGKTIVRLNINDWNTGIPQGALTVQLENIDNLDETKLESGLVPIQKGGAYKAFATISLKK